MIIRAAHRKQFAVVSSEVLEDARISFKAKGLLTYLLSRPEDWEVQEKHLATVSTEGVSAVRSAIAELREHGYAEKRKILNRDGTIHHWETAVFERAKEDPTPGHVISYVDGFEPDLENPNVDPDSEKLNVDEAASEPDLENPHVGNPQEENLKHTQERDLLKKEKTQHGASAAAARELDENPESTDNELTALEVYHEIREEPDGAEYLQRMLGYYFDDENRGRKGADSLMAPSVLASTWLQVRDVFDSEGQARAYADEKLSQLRADDFTSLRVVMKYLRDDAAEYATRAKRPKPGRKSETDVGRNDYDSKAADEPGTVEQDEPPDVNHPPAWSSARNALKSQMSEFNWQAWIAKLYWHSIDAGVVHLVAWDAFAADHIAAKYSDLIADAIDGADSVRVHRPGDAPQLEQDGHRATGAAQ